MQGRPHTHLVDFAALALGYLQAITASLACLSVMISFGVIPLYFAQYDSQQSAMTVLMLATILGASLFLLGYLITFAVLLIIGVKKRQAGYVLAYLITGVVKVGIVLTAWVLCIVYGAYWSTVLKTFCALVVYSIWLFTVYCVYNNIKLEKNPNSLAYNTLQNPKEMEAQKVMKIAI